MLHDRSPTSDEDLEQPRNSDSAMDQACMSLKEAFHRAHSPESSTEENNHKTTVVFCGEGNKSSSSEDSA